MYGEDSQQGACWGDLGLVGVAKGAGVGGCGKDVMEREPVSDQGRGPG